jgi:hypothetical protein
MANMGKCAAIKVEPSLFTQERLLELFADFKKESYHTIWTNTKESCMAICRSLYDIIEAHHPSKNGQNVFPNGFDAAMDVTREPKVKNPLPVPTF